MHTATYSPEDNKIRLTFDGRIPQEEWDRLRKAGFTWTMKQDSSMVAPWTPQREDLALEYADIIEDEDQPRAERAAARAERFGDYRNSGCERVGAMLHRLDAMPSAYGHQNHDRAAAKAAKRDHLITRAVSEWDKPEYWQRRTEGVIRNELYLQRADVRHRRIKKLKSQLRLLRKRQSNHYTGMEVAYKRMTNLKNHLEFGEEIQVGPIFASTYAYVGGTELPDGTYPAEIVTRAAIATLLEDLERPHVTHAWTYPDPVGTVSCSLYHHYVYHRLDLPSILSIFFTANPVPPVEPESTRWSRHLELRIRYEEDMIRAVGGTAANAVASSHLHDPITNSSEAAPTIIEPGGWIGTMQVVKVTKDANGDLSKIYLQGKIRSYDERESLIRRKAESVDLTKYRPPTDAERQALLSQRKEQHAKANPPIINLTKASAEALSRLVMGSEPDGGLKVPVVEMTIKHYQYHAKGDWAIHHMATLHAWSGGKVTPGNMRVRYLQKHSIHSTRPPAHLIVLTDKPQVTMAFASPTPEPVTTAS